MFTLILLPALLQIAVPLALIAWVAFADVRSRALWVLGAVTAAVWLMAIDLAGLWTVLPWYTARVWAVLLLVAIYRSARRVWRQPGWPSSRPAWLRTAVMVVGLLLCSALLIRAMSGRRPFAAPAIDLTFPMNGGTYHAVSAGSAGLLNAHLATLSEPRFRPWRGQSYGIDLVRLNRWGFRARGAMPRSPAAYVIYGDSVHAPCDGTVVEASDGLADLRPPSPDREHMAGNHVLLDCGGTWVLLGHLRQRSVRIRRGDSVRTGAFLGSVGNTGNSNEPHLHIHAQRPGSAAAPLSGDPVPITFGGRHLVRNARLRTPLSGEHGAFRDSSAILYTRGR